MSARHILHALSDSEDNASYHLLFFIPGNPGLISYYETFLAEVNNLLSQHYVNSKVVFHIYGQSLAGFDDGSESNEVTSPCGLDEQIAIMQKSIESRMIPHGPRAGQSYDGLILMGHSLGAYMCLETMSRMRKAVGNDTGSPTGVTIKGAVLLFATVVNLAGSSNGRKVRGLFYMPNFPSIAASLAKIWMWPLPNGALKWLLASVIHIPPDAAEVTAKFLQSKMGVWQTLHLARDELEMITEDKWEEEIWSSGHGNQELAHLNPRLVFYFGKKDGWVANKTRDALIAERGRGEGDTTTFKPLMIVESDGDIGHAFCLKHSEIIADKVNKWVQYIMN